MGLETGTYISDLNASNPAAGDLKSQGDDHIRLIKSTVKNTFPNVTGAVTPTHTQLNYVAGVTSGIQAQLDTKAPLVSPSLTGTPTAPTAASNTNTTQVATTAFVIAERTNAATLTNKTLTSPVINSPTGLTKADVGLGSVDNTSDLGKPVSTATQAALDLKANINSPSFTGTPTAPTASLGTNTTQIATTAFVQAAGNSIAYPLAQDVSGGGFFIDNVKIGNNTPLEGKFTNLTAAGTTTVVALLETRVAMGANDINLTSGNYFTKTFTAGSVSLTVSNVPAAGKVACFILDATNAGTATITWPTGSKWGGGTAPTLTSAGRDLIAGFTHDGGTTWNLMLLAKDIK